MMFQEIAKKAKAAQTETNPGAQHKALLDWGESLLNLCAGFLFGEYKRYQQIIEPVERGLYLAATRSVSLGQQWGFVRDIATNLQESALRDLFSKGVKHEQAGEYLFYFKRVKQQCIENPDPSLRIRTGFKDAIAERCRGQSPTPVTKQVFFDEAFIPMRNIYAHPKQTLRKTGEQIEWPLAEEYFGLFNPLLQNSLEEIQKDLESVLGNYKVTDLVRKSEQNGEVEQSGNKIDVELPEYLLDETEDETKVLLSEQGGQPYVRFYEHEKPSVSAEVRERIVKEESKRQSRALLEQLIHKAFSNDDQIDETEYFNLKLTSDVAGYTEDELDQLIKKYLKSRGLNDDYEVVAVSGSNQISWNPWWCHYFGLKSGIAKKLDNSATLSNVKRGESEKRETQEYYHKLIWDELNDYVSKVVESQLDLSDVKWKTNPNEWQQGRLTSYYWNRIYPKISPLGSTFFVGLFSDSRVGTANIRIEAGIDRDRLVMFDYNPEIVDDLLKKWSEILLDVTNKYQSELIQYDTQLFFEILNLDSDLSRFRYFKRGHQWSKGKSLIIDKYLDRYNSTKSHVSCRSFLMRIFDYDKIEITDEKIKKSFLLYSLPIIEITNYAIEKGYDIETAYRIKKREPKSSQIKKTLDDINSESFQIDRVNSSENISDSSLSESNQETTHGADFEDVFVYHFKNKSEQVDTFESVLQQLVSLTQSIQYRGGEKNWQKNFEKLSRYSTAVKLECGMQGYLGFRLDEEGTFYCIVRIEDRAEDLDAIDRGVEWIEQNENWLLMENDGIFRNSYSDGATNFGIEKLVPLSDSEVVEQIMLERMKELAKDLERFNELYPKPEEPEAESETAGKTVFAPYVLTSLEIELTNPLHQALEIDMTSWLSQIVKDEGPVHRQILIWRLCATAGIAKAGSRIQERIREVLSKMVQSGEILSDGDFHLLKGQGYLPRNRSESPNQERNPDFVSNQELNETQKALGTSVADASIWRALGYARVTAAMTERLEGLEDSKQ